MESLIHNIRRQKIFLSETEEGLIRSKVKIKQIKKKDYLLRAGQFCSMVTFVNYGCLRSYYLGPDNLHIMQLAIKDWWIGDLKNFVLDRPSQLYIDAIENSEVFQITKLDLEELYEKVPQLERFFRLQMQNALVSHQERILNNLTLQAKERYELFRKRYSDFHQKIPLKDIANYLGVTPEHLSYIRRNQ